MKEYVGFLETGWDCTNEHCGKSDSHTFTVPTPESGTYNYKIYATMEPGTQVGEWKPVIKQFPEIRPIDVKIFVPTEQPPFPRPSDASDIFFKGQIEVNILSGDTATSVASKVASAIFGCGVSAKCGKNE